MSSRLPVMETSKLRTMVKVIQIVSNLFLVKTSTFLSFSSPVFGPDCHCINPLLQIKDKYQSTLWSRSVHTMEHDSI